MEFVTEFNLQLTDTWNEEDGEETKIFNLIITDNYQYLETGTIMHRNMTINVEGEMHFIDFMFEEVDTGVVVYVNVEDIVDIMVAEGAEVDVLMTTIGADEDWLMFRFDDTLDNMVELEVMRDMIADIFFLEVGATFFYDLQDEIDLELGLNLSDYGVDLGMFVEYLLTEDYAAAELMMDTIEYEELVFDLDAIHLVPELINFLTDYAVDLDAAGFPTATKILFLQDPLNGTQAFLEGLTDAEIVILLDVLVDAEIDDEEAPDFSDMFEAYLDGELDHFIVMFILEQPDVVFDLREIPSFDFDVYKAAMDPSEFEEMIYDLDQDYVVPEMVQLLEWNESYLYSQGFDVWVKSNELEEFGSLYFFDNLTPGEITALMQAMDWQYFDNNDDYIVIEDFYNSYVLGDHDQFIVEFVIGSPNISAGLRSFPGIDYDLFVFAMDNLDYDAFYLEEIDLELLAEAIRGGESEFDIYLTELDATAPETASILDAFRGTVLELEEVMIYVEDFIYVLDNINIFEEYLDLQYYLDNDMVTYALETTEDFEIETTITFDASESSQLYVDLIAEVYWFLDDMESFEMPYVDHINCPTGETCDTFEDYLTVIADLDQLGYVELVALYDPSNPDELTMLLDLTNFAQSVHTLEELNGTIDDISVKFTVREAGTVTLPTETSNMNDIAQDFAKVSLNFMTYDFVRDALEYYVDNPGEFAIGNFALDSYDGYITPSLAFDANMSYITVGGSFLSPTISCTLYWADGTQVFTEPITLAYLDVMMAGDFPTAADYQTLLSKVDDANWNMTKMIIVFLFSDVDNVQEKYSPE